MNASLVTPSTTTVTIPLNDPIVFSTSNVSVYENAGTATITVKLSGGAIVRRDGQLRNQQRYGDGRRGNDYTLPAER